MEINSFISKFAEQLEETDPQEITASTEFRNLEEWSSLTALSILAMVDEEYDVQLDAAKMREANTVKELFDIVNQLKK